MILVNGELQSSIDVTDRGLQYGDGLFETLAVFNGKPVFLNPHLSRLKVGCHVLAIPYPDADLLTDEIAKLCRYAIAHFTRGQAVIKIMITRGSGGRGYRPPDVITSSRIISLYPWPDNPKNSPEVGIQVRFCKTRLGTNPALAGIKHLNRLEQVLARAEWHDPEIQEGIMLNANGYVIEGTMSNLFYVKNQTLYTASLNEAGIMGIIRQQIILLARQLGYPVIEHVYLPETLMQADEVFVCNSIIGIWPIRAIEAQYFSIGTVTRQLQLKLKQAMREDACAD